MRTVGTQGKVILELDTVSLFPPTTSKVENEILLEHYVSTKAFIGKASKF